jgi:hypothetical protein
VSLLNLSIEQNLCWTGPRQDILLLGLFWCLYNFGQGCLPRQNGFFLQSWYLGWCRHKLLMLSLEWYITSCIRITGFLLRFSLHNHHIWLLPLVWIGVAVQKLVTTLFDDLALVCISWLLKSVDFWLWGNFLGSWCWFLRLLDRRGGLWCHLISLGPFLRFLYFSLARWPVKLLWLRNRVGF